LWGTIFYKIYQAVYPAETTLAVPNYSKLPLLEQPTTDSIFTLLVNYRDPFLSRANTSNYSQPRKSYAFNNRSTPNKNRPQQIKKIEKNIPIQKKPPKPFPKIIYQGYQFSGGDTTALLKVDQRFYPAVHVGQMISNIYIMGIYKDSIKIRQDSILRVFVKSSK
jgi:hypothetical protein